MLTALLAGTGTALAADSEPQVRAAVARALPYLADEGDLWIEERQCASCHHTGLLAWSHRLAESRGFEIDGGLLTGWTDWMLEHELAPRRDEEGNERPGINADGDREGAAQLVLGGGFSVALEQGDDEAIALYGRLHEALSAGQGDDGLWKAGGQLPTQKRPAEETHRVSTAWIVLALDSLPGADANAARRRALEALMEHDGGGAATSDVSTEAAAVRTLISLRFRSPGDLQALLSDLLSRQQDDGGWPWLAGDASDALATGQALYALAECKERAAAGEVEAIDSAIERGHAFLVATQRDDGSWRTLSTKEKNKAKSTGISNFFGSSWAVIGLCRTLPEAEVTADQEGS